MADQVKVCKNGSAAKTDRDSDANGTEEVNLTDE